MAEKTESVAVRGHSAGAGPSRGVDTGDGDIGASIRRRLGEAGAHALRLGYTNLLGQSGFVLVPAADLTRALAGRLAVPDGDRVSPATVLSPDPRTLRFLPVGDATAATAHLTCDLHLSDGATAPACTRQALKRVVESLRKMGLTIRVSVDCLLRLSATASPDIELLSPAMERAVVALTDCQVHGLTVRCSGASESLAIGFGPLSPIEAADALPLLSSLLARAGRQCGRPPLVASPALSRLGLSFYRGKRSLFAGQGTPRIAAAAFLSGTRAHAPGLTALLRPALAGATGVFCQVGAAIDSEETPGWTWGSGWAGPLSLRLARDSGSVTASGLDGTGNPYLMLAGLISAGLAGLRQTNGVGDASCEPDGAPPFLPDPASALAALVTDECLRDGLGGPTVDAYAEAVTCHWERTRPADRR